MTESDILQFVQANIEPLEEGAARSPMYRCSATLKDGLYLPCVTIRSRQSWTALAMKRFAECQEPRPGWIKRLAAKINSFDKRPNIVTNSACDGNFMFWFDTTAKAKPRNQLRDYANTVESFVCSGNQLAWYDIKGLGESPYAIPRQRMAEIVGETYMNWTQFTATMKDGRDFEFGTMYSMEFFDMPEGYTGKDIARITPARRGTPRREDIKFLREKPFFDCYIKGI
jgi:hypothetical protein